MAEAPARRWPAVELRLETGPPAPSGAQDFDERLSLLLDDLSATALEQPSERTYRVYFCDSAGRDAAVAALQQALGHRCRVAPVDVEDEGWLHKVQSALGVVRVGRFVVAPPWDVPEDTGDEAPLLIIVEPSMGFGTGHHESTRLCLRALDAVEVAGRRVLDVGTGSGVLAIAAAKLSAAQVVAVDVDPDAAASARDNARLNGVDQAVSVVEADFATATLDPADLVLANLTAATLVRQASRLRGLVGPGGTLVASGFTSDQLPIVTDAFPGAHAAERLSENGWECVVFRCI